MDITAEDLTNKNLYDYCHAEDLQKIRKSHCDRKYFLSVHFCVIFLQIRYSILACSVLKVKTYPISVCPIGGTVQAKSCTVQPQGVHKWVFHLCLPLLCPEK